MDERLNALCTQISRFICIAFSVFQIYTVAFGQFAAFQQRLIHLSFALTLVFLIKPLSKSVWQLRLTDIILSLASAFIGIWGALNYQELWMRSGSPEPFDIVVALVLVVIMLEATRRVIGLTLPVLVMFSLAYAHFGAYFPEPFTNKGYSWYRIANDLFLTTSGIFGSPLAASSSVVAIFVIFAAMLEASGAGDAFMDVANALFGRIRGGPAKVAVVSSSLMGMVSGSAVANVVGTGSITIPLMKKIGLNPNFAAGVEAVASTGGQLMPPVMGAAAFIMAEIVGVPYGTICLAAVVPAVLYYISLFIAVDSEAVKNNIMGLTELPKFSKVMREKGQFFFPLFVLVFAMAVVKLTPHMSAFYAMLSIVLLILIDRRGFPEKKHLMIDGLVSGGRGLVEVAVTCGCAGIVIGMLMLSGLGLNISSILVNLAGSNLLILLLLTMVSSLVLGMGLPTSACYVILAVLVAPAIERLGVPRLAAHLFVLYFGVIANITPPVALAAYAGASIARSDPFKTGVTACKIGLVAFFVPYYFVYRPEVLFIGELNWTMFVSIATILLSVFAINGAITGVMYFKLPTLVRVFYACAALALFYPIMLADIVGYILLLVGTVFLLTHRAKANAPVLEPD